MTTTYAEIGKDVAALKREPNLRDWAETRASWSWDAVRGELDLPGGLVNMAHECIDRHAAANPSKVAMLWEGADGSVEVEITPGLTGDLPLNLAGLAKEQVLVNGNEKTGEAEGGYSYYVVKVEEGAELARFALDSAVAEPAADLDLFVYRVVSPTDWRYYETWTSASAAADESVQLAAPTAGYYLVEAHVYSYTAPFTWTGTSAVVMPTGEGSLTATPNPIAAQESVPTTFDLSWSGLGAGDYWGVVRYGDSQVRTVVSVDVP